jgi:hypothetical protein
MVSLCGRDTPSSCIVLYACTIISVLVTLSTAVTDVPKKFNVFLCGKAIPSSSTV